MVQCGQQGVVATSLRLGRLLSERLGGDPERVTEFRDLSRSIRHLHEKAMRADTELNAYMTEHWQARGVDWNHD